LWREFDGVFQRSQSAKHPWWCQVMVLVLVLDLAIKKKQNVVC
jgi:hypothetical protein